MNKVSFTSALAPLDFYDQINIKPNKHAHAYPAAVLLLHRSIRVRFGRLLFDWDDRYMSCPPKWRCSCVAHCQTGKCECYDSD